MGLHSIVITDMSLAEFRKLVRTNYPHIKISVRTVSFADLARASAKCLTVEKAQSAQELAQVNAWAKAAGVLPDTSLRSFPRYRETTPRSLRSEPPELTRGRSDG